MSWGMPQDERRFGGLPKRWIIFIAALFMVSSTFAINININGNNRVEFGQGIYQIKACDQYVALEFISTNSINGYSRVGGIIFKGLDVQKCKGTAMRLRLYQTGSNTPLNLYTNSTKTETGTAVIMIISKNATGPTFADDVTLVNNKGVNISYGDSMQAIDFDPGTGNFVITYAYPLAEMRNVNSVTLESASV
ncbi:hypothetical protein MCEMRH37_01258 [Candidatus Nanopelagicaceae bacterium]